MNKPSYKLSNKEKAVLWLIAIGVIVVSMGISLIYSGYKTSKLEVEVSYCHTQNDYLMDVVRAHSNEEDGMTSSMSYEQVEVCDPTATWKSWMPYQAITYQPSDQYQQLQLHGIATDHYYGFITLDGYLMVAMGEMYGPIGTKYLVSFSGGTSVEVIIAEFKHEGCTSSRDGSMIEFLVDTEKMPESIKKSGNFNDLFAGTITEMYRIGE